MSAEPTGHIDHSHRSPAPRLTLVPRSAGAVPTLGFVALVSLLVVVGLAGVMVVTTSVASQSSELSDLRQEATELSYTAAALTTELHEKSSSASLALRATDLGMVPNPYPAFLSLADGSIQGDPQPVTGNEAPYLNSAASADPAANDAAAGVSDGEAAAAEETDG
ncbi:MAG: hypothetical protein ACK5KO_05690 [Arachnia sp.]